MSMREAIKRAATSIRQMSPEQARALVKSAGDSPLVSMLCEMSASVDRSYAMVMREKRVMFSGLAWLAGTTTSDLSHAQFSGITSLFSDSAPEEAPFSFVGPPHPECANEPFYKLAA